MRNILPDYPEEHAEPDDDEKLDNAFDEMEMLYRTRCGNIGLSKNVTVVEIDEPEEDKSLLSHHKI